MKLILVEELARVFGGHRRGYRHRHSWGSNHGHCHQYRYPDGSRGTPCG